MNFFDGLDMLSAVSRRASAAIVVALLVGLIGFREPTTNLLWGQAMQGRVAIVNAMGSISGVHCAVEQDGLFGPPTVRCE